MKKQVMMILVAILFALGIVGMSASAEEVVVEKGDTLWGLAKERETTVEDLMKINELTSTTIYPGQVLQTEKVTEEEEEEKEVEDEEDTYYTYLIEKGDTLWDISQEYDVTVSQLMKWNDLNSDLILAGSELVIDLTAEREEVEVVIVSTQPKSQPAQKKSVQQQAAPSAPATTEKAEPAKEETTAQKPAGKTFSVEATAYTAGCKGCSGITATGINLWQNPDMKVIAVDPKVIPLGTKVYVEGYGEAIAGDTGGAIKGNKIDLYMRYHQDAVNWGRRTVQITLLE